MTPKQATPKQATPKQDMPEQDAPQETPGDGPIPEGPCTENGSPPIIPVYDWVCEVCIRLLSSKSAKVNHIRTHTPKAKPEKQGRKPYKKRQKSSQVTTPQVATPEVTTPQVINSPQVTPPQLLENFGTPRLATNEEEDEEEEGEGMLLLKQ